MNIYELFLQMQNMEKGCIIKNPHDLVLTDFYVPNLIKQIIEITEKSLYFTRLSLKHIAEKGEAGLYIINNIQNILNEPDSIHLGNFTNRFLISKKIIFSTNEKAHGIILEITKENQNVIVTGFIAKEAYFKNLKLLWRATYSPSQQPPKK